MFSIYFHSLLSSHHSFPSTPCCHAIPVILIHHSWFSWCFCRHFAFSLVSYSDTNYLIFKNLYTVCGLHVIQSHQGHIELPKSNLKKLIPIFILLLKEKSQESSSELITITILLQSPLSSPVLLHCFLLKPCHCCYKPHNLHWVTASELGLYLLKPPLSASYAWSFPLPQP